MQHTTPSKLKEKTTIKTLTATIAVLGSKLHSDETIECSQLLGKEIARQGHIACIFDNNEISKAVLAASLKYNGISIGYYYSENHGNINPTHSVITNTNYEHCLSMMLRSAAAIIYLPQNTDALRPFTQPLTNHQILGVLTNNTDLSLNLSDLHKVSSLSEDSIVLDSSPLHLIKRIHKLLRERQLLVHNNR